MWRYFDRLPLNDPAHIVTLGEGATPCVDISDSVGAWIGLRRLWLKAEDRNPTGSFKARIASVAYSLIRERGLAGAVGTSSGNGGAAAAAYAAASGSRAMLFTLSDTTPAKMREITAVGGIAKRVRGVGHDAASTIAVADRIAAAAERHGWYPMLTGFRYAPEAMAGVKTIAYELSEQAPDAARVYAPVGGGGLLTGIHRGYADLDGRIPSLIGVHPEGSDALSRSLSSESVPPRTSVDTAISGLQMAVLYDTEGAVAAVRSSGGAAVAVSDEAIYRAQALLASAGLLVEPAGATALAGLIADLDAGRAHEDEPTVIVATGAAYKDSVALDRLAGGEVEVIEPDDVADALAEIERGRA